ncbi:MAG: hypothetical protein SOI56_07475 [Eubacteriales bacterium]|jgi:hypothetical protein
MKNKRLLSGLLSGLIVFTMAVSGCGENQDDTNTEVTPVSESSTASVEVSSESGSGSETVISTSAVSSESVQSESAGDETVSGSSGALSAVSAGSGENSAETSGSSSGSASSSSSAEKDPAEEFNTLMGEIKDSVFPGTAGSSLNAAYSGAELLTWYVADKENLDEATIRQMRDDYEAGLDDVETFTQQLDAVAESIQDLYNEDSQAILSDSGWTDEITWTEEDCTLLGQALISDTTAN